MPSTASISNKLLPVCFLAIVCLMETASGEGKPLTTSPPPTGAVLYTNFAGQTIRGPVQRVEKGSVWFGDRSYSLSIFPENERKRILQAMGKESPSPEKNLEAQRRDDFYRNLLDRQDALEKMGATTREKAEAQRKKIREAWNAGQGKKERTETDRNKQ